MSHQNQTAKLEWRDDCLPIATQFDDPYFSLNDGLAESRHVFLAGNDLPDRFCEGFHIAELGFGTGLNLLAAWDAWIESGVSGPLKFTSFEAFPMEISDMARALRSWPELSYLAEEMLNHLHKGRFNFATDSIEANIIVGDARQTLPKCEEKADAWFLDGFSPAKNPELWEAPLMQAVANHTKDNGSFATYTAAGFVRSNLAEAGFEVERTNGFGRKRHMSLGRKP